MADCRRCLLRSGLASGLILRKSWTKQAGHPVDVGFRELAVSLQSRIRWHWCWRGNTGANNIAIASKLAE